MPPAHIIFTFYKNNNKENRIILGYKKEYNVHTAMNIIWLILIAVSIVAATLYGQARGAHPGAV